VAETTGSFIEAGKSLITGAQSAYTDLSSEAAMRYEQGSLYPWVDNTQAGFGSWASDTVSNFFSGGWQEDPYASYNAWGADNRERLIRWGADTCWLGNTVVARSSDKLFVGDDRQGAVEDVLSGLSGEYGPQRVQAVFDADFSTATADRIYPADLRTLMSTRLQDRPDSRPLAVVVFPEADHNGAFLDDEDQLSQLINSGYRVQFYTANSDTDTVNSVMQATDYGKDPASLILLCGHGNPGGMRFGIDSTGDEEMWFTAYDNQRLDLGDVDEARLLTGALRDGGQVVFNSCSVGNGKAESLNLINFFGNFFPQASLVAGATETLDSMHMTIVNNNVVDVQYRNDGELVDTYDAVSGQVSNWRENE
jgi:hypothetical protein